MIRIDNLDNHNFTNKKISYKDEIYLVENYCAYRCYNNSNCDYHMSIRQITNNNEDYLFYKRNRTIHLTGNDVIKEFLSLCDLVLE